MTLFTRIWTNILNIIYTTHVNDKEEVDWSLVTIIFVSKSRRCQKELATINEIRRTKQDFKSLLNLGTSSKMCQKHDFKRTKCGSIVKADYVCGKITHLLVNNLHTKLLYTIKLSNCGHWLNKSRFFNGYRCNSVF